MACVECGRSRSGASKNCASGVAGPFPHDSRPAIPLLCAPPLETHSRWDWGSGWELRIALSPLKRLTISQVTRRLGVLSTLDRDFPDERDLPVRDLAWTRIGQAPNDRVQRNTAKSMRRRAGRPTGRTDGLRRLDPRVYLRHPATDHRRPPRLDATSIRPRRTIIPGLAPPAADRSGPGSPRTTPRERIPRPAGRSPPWHGARPSHRS